MEFQNFIPSVFLTILAKHFFIFCMAYPLPFCCGMSESTTIAIFVFIANRANMFSWTKFVIIAIHFAYFSLFAINKQYGISSPYFKNDFTCWLSMCDLSVIEWIHSLNKFLFPQTDILSRLYEFDSLWIVPFSVCLINVVLKKSCYVRHVIIYVITWHIELMKAWTLHSNSCCNILQLENNHHLLIVVC